ncbi:MAG TPA: zinc ABC transporter substrate-binding protein [Candidatus Dormibacteraeota bacterium]|jgi:zinc/manganese transport system substrate-binding protein|nr:zinc ABC transporter substrate-binding protein [Candidatus Dormibacteraeota bacterium]
MSQFVVMPRLRPGILVLLAALALGGCGLNQGTPAAGSGGKVEVVAAENFWGSIAAQVGGDRVHVTSVIVNPDTDPHAYEAKPADARTIARARYVIVNGAGYDPWAPKLLDANPVSGRQVLVIGDLLGKKEGDNPHFWYSPGYVGQVIDRITADLEKLDPAGAADYGQRNSQYKTVGLKEYTSTINVIRQRYAGTPVGATESIFVYLADATGLNLITPPEYLKAVSEGTDPSAADKVTIQEQVAQRKIRVLVFNSQNTTPDVNAVVDAARAQKIPVTSVTETLAPATATFQDWQTGQLKALLAALGG